MVWRSQAGQDQWVIETLGPGPGYFVDVGAHDGVVHSNTWTLEVEFGWRGLCIEPNANVYELLQINRACSTIDYAASDVIRDDGYLNGDRLDTVGQPVKLRTLDWFLTTFGEGSGGVVDYLSVDAEGHDLDVLRGHDFDRWHVRLITVEHNLYCDGPARKNAIYDHLTANGFERVREDVVAEGYGPYEDWFQSA